MCIFTYNIKTNKMRRTKNDIIFEIKNLKYELKLVNPILCPIYCAELTNKINIKTILLNAL